MLNAREVAFVERKKAPKKYLGIGRCINGYLQPKSDWVMISQLMSCQICIYSIRNKPSMRRYHRIDSIAGADFFIHKPKCLAKYVCNTLLGFCCRLGKLVFAFADNPISQFKINKCTWSALRVRFHNVACSVHSFVREIESKGLKWKPYNTPVDFWFRQ